MNFCDATQLIFNYSFEVATDFPNPVVSECTLPIDIPNTDLSQIFNFRILRSDLCANSFSREAGSMLLHFLSVTINEVAILSQIT